MVGLAYTLASLFVLVLLGVGVLLVLVAWGYDLGAGLLRLFQSLRQWPAATGAAGVAAAVVAGYLGIRLAWRRPESPALVRPTALGEMRISGRALESLTYRAVRALPGVREVEARLSNGEDGLVVDVSLQVEADTRIPDLVERVQARVAEYLATTAGVEVRKVPVRVGAIHTPQARPREGERHGRP